MKRLIDIILSAIGLLFCLPLFLVTALLIKLDSKGPIFFVQDRSGKNGKLFKFVKFRTMVENAAEIGPQITQKNDLRITTVGNLLRWLKIDELPQLINVLKGDMSLIGPRPEIPYIVNRHKAEFKKILMVKPGVVGPSQILGRDELSKYPEKYIDTIEYYEQVILPEKLAIDKKYVEKAGLWSDLKFLVHGAWITVFGAIKPSYIVSLRSRLILIFLDSISIVLAYLLATALRFEFSIPIRYWDLSLKVIPVLVLLTIGFLIYMQVYQKLWTFVETSSFIVIVKAVLYATAFTFLVLFILGVRNHPRSILLMYLPLVINFFIISRLALRAVRLRYINSKEKVPDKKAIIVGIGQNLSGVLYHLLHDQTLNREIVGFVDNKDEYRGMTLEGLKVLGKIYDVPQIIKSFDVSEVFVLPANVNSKELRFINEFCKTTDTKVRIIPTIGDLINGSVHISKVRDMDITDLLGRKPVKLDLSEVKHLIKGKKVMVSGAGGSIGSELCRQIGEFEPSNLIIIDKAENYLHDILLDLKDMYPELRITDFNTSITNQRKIEYIFSKYKPELVLHAAAHKHVPLSETNPDEAIINNVYGTKIIALTAAKFRVDTFVMISSDKAVNPCSVMGSTKRIAELYIQHLSTKNSTRFITIRFGNVLGSNGSVVQIFKKQIEKGGPITLTDPEMTRYFMTIPEACQLVLQASAIGENGQILMLDMGEPVKIVELAQDMIKLYGLEPDKNIKIQTIGLRPGEKLFEELFYKYEDPKPTKHEKIKVVNRYFNDRNIDKDIDELFIKALEFDLEGLHKKIKDIVPSYRWDFQSPNYLEKEDYKELTG